MNKKAEIDVDLSSVLVIGALALICIVILGAFVSAEIRDFIDGIINDPNKDTKYYDVTCEFGLSNPLGRDVEFSGEFLCYFRKHVVGFGLFDWYNDKGNIGMTVGDLTRYTTYSLDEGQSQNFKITVSKVEKGIHNIKVTAYDDLGKQITSRAMILNIGE